MSLKFIKMYCPNCGALVGEYVGEKGQVVVSCSRCNVNLFSRTLNKKEIIIKIRKLV